MSTLGKIPHIQEHKGEQGYCAVFHGALRRSQRLCSKNAQASMVPEQFICEILSIGALCFESYHVGRAFVAGHRTRSSKEELTRSPNYYNASFQARCYTYIANPQVLSLANMYPYAREGLHFPIQKCVTASGTDKQSSAVAENNVCYLKDEYIERVHMFQVQISRKPFAFVPCGRNVF